jgi:plastocyanin
MNAARGRPIGRRQFSVILAAWTDGMRGRDEPEPGRVAIRDFTFTPARVAVGPGQTVEWINQDDVPHSVVHAGHPHLFRSGVLFQGERFVFRFDRPGEYAYFCGVYRHMRGVVRVG